MRVPFPPSLSMYCPTVLLFYLYEGWKRISCHCVNLKSIYYEESCASLNVFNIFEVTVVTRDCGNWPRVPAAPIQWLSKAGLSHETPQMVTLAQGLHNNLAEMSPRLHCGLGHFPSNFLSSLLHLVSDSHCDLRPVPVSPYSFLLYSPTHFTLYI